MITAMSDLRDVDGHTRGLARGGLGTARAVPRRPRHDAHRIRSAARGARRALPLRRLGHARLRRVAAASRRSSRSSCWRTPLHSSSRRWERRARTSRASRWAARSRCTRRSATPRACARSRCSTRARRSGSTAPIPRPGSGSASIRWMQARPRRASRSRCSARSWRPVPTKARSRPPSRRCRASRPRGCAPPSSACPRTTCATGSARSPCPRWCSSASATTETPLSYAEALAAGIRGTRLQIVPGAGHISNLEAPEAVNIALREHLDGMDATA